MERNQPGNGGTRCRAIAIHADAARRKQHVDTGYEEGWSAALDQLVTLAKRL